MDYGQCITSLHKKWKQNQQTLDPNMQTGTHNGISQLLSNSVSMDSFENSRISEIDLRKPKSGFQGLNMRAARSVFKLQPLERELKQTPTFIMNQPYQDYIL